MNSRMLLLFLGCLGAGLLDVAQTQAQEAQTKAQIECRSRLQVSLDTAQVAVLSDCASKLPKPLPEEGTLATVLYIGGFKSSAPQMADWTATVQVDPQYGKAFQFVAQEYPSPKSDPINAVKDGAALIKKWVNEIDSHPDRTYFLAGHSSGAYLSLEIAKGVANPAQVKVISLEGSVDLQFKKGIDVTCWYAQSSRPGVGAYYRASSPRCNRVRYFRDMSCLNSTCVHFTIINLNAAQAGIAPGNYNATGYLYLKANLEWLAEFLPVTH